MKNAYIAALVGAPNCGKTALFNQLTGSRQKVANYAGVTVEKKEGDLNCPSGQRIHIIDLPGTYSLTPTSLDESITRRVVMGQLKDEVAPDLLVCVVDSTNLRLHLRLVLELTRLKKPMVLVLNMMDVARSQGLQIDVKKLSHELSIPVVECIAVDKQGAHDVVDFLDQCNLADHQNALLPWKDPTTHELQQMQHRVREIIELTCDESIRHEGVTERLDNIIMHPVWGMLILMCVLFFTFQAVFSWANLPMKAIQHGIDWISISVNHWLPQGLLRALLVDGVISGAGSVIEFLPQILILFAFILALEDSGYLPRAAFLLDRIMGSVGLSGRSFIPLLSSFACAIPGVMATRTIQNPRDRLTTILIAPLMTCSARLPVYGLLIAAFIPHKTVMGLFNLQGLVLFSLYMGGIVSAMLVALVLKKTIGRRHYQPLMMELPAYRLPHLRNLAMGLLERAEIFTSRVGKIILPMMIILWFLSSFPGAPANASNPAISYSLAGKLGEFLQHIFAPIGFNWQICLALVPGLAAREVAVGALGTVYALASSGGEVSTSALAPVLHQSWSLATALSLLVWYIFAPQCVATLGAVKRETNSWRIPSIMLTYLFALGYIASFITYRLTLMLGG
ncbi:ferrous iron transport protein B [Ferrovum sp. JA12]|uniref:ferrous iron transporter B n=1 Tax=Ferrovum sp. JA12 TaxID=1356299 RepID=UPI00070371A5|nr:ferrous iron transporter B [Ferrovum sp. JA12]KRH79780.1 ferrous iron transport protein B [Ferrovum sp. JA12]